MMDFFVIYVNILCLSHPFTVCMFYNITVNTHDFTLYLNLFRLDWQVVSAKKLYTEYPIIQK